MRLHLVGTLISALLLLMPAHAKDKVPSALQQEILIKASLLRLNDANVTGNYTVLHAKLAKQFRDRITPDKLKLAFKSFAEKSRLGPDRGKSAGRHQRGKIDNRGALILRGYFDTRPSRLTDELDFMISEREWRPVMLNVNLKSPED